MDIKQLRAFIQELIDEDRAEEKVSQANEDYDREEKYDYAATRLETVLEVTKLFDAKETPVQDRRPGRGEREKIDIDWEGDYSLSKEQGNYE
ncbi:MAG: hypothetical protein WC180_03110 [Candidatus Paceibacterota bacterium]